MADRLPPRAPKADWGNVSKNLALWLLIGLLALALFNMMSKQRSGVQDFTYTEFSDQLTANNIAKVEVFDGRYVEGDFKTPVAKEGRPARSFKVLLPIANSEAFLNRLQSAGVPISAKEPRGGLTALLLSALP